MPDCECLPGCPFFNGRMKDMKGMATIYKRRYCQGDNSECARYIVFSTLGKEHVPADLYPNMRDRAEQIITNARDA